MLFTFIGTLDKFVIHLGDARVSLSGPAATRRWCEARRWRASI